MSGEPLNGGLGRSSIRIGLRLARRELRRAPWRSFLVVVMVLVPTAAMGAGVTMIRTGQWSGAEARSALWGQADAVATPGEPDPMHEGLRLPNESLPVTGQALDDLEAALPPGATIAVEHTRFDRLALEHERSYLTVSDLPVDAPVARGRFGGLEGELPRDATELVLSRAAADGLDATIGDVVEAARPSRHLTVTGIVQTFSNDRTGYIGSTLEGTSRSVGTNVLIDLPDSDPPSLPFDVPGWAVQPVQVLVGPSEVGLGVLWTYVAGGIALLVFGTIIAAAFAVSARRQLHTVGLLAASGGPPRAVAWCLGAQGAITGFIGSVLGVALSVVVTRLLPDELLRSVANRPVEGPVTRPLDLLPIIGLGVAIAAGAALLPARAASRIPVLQALAGRRPLAAVPGRLLLTGAVSLGAGCALLATAVAGGRTASDGGTGWSVIGVTGGMALLVGVLCSTPWLVARLERSGRRWPEPARLAGRSLARSRVRSSAVVAAIATVAAGVVAGTTLSTSLDDEQESVAYLREGQLVVESSVTVELPVELRDPSADPADPWASVTQVPAEPPRDVIDRISAVLPEATVLPLEHLVPAGLPAAVAGQSAVFASYARDPGVDPSAHQLGWGLGIATAELLDLLDAPDDLRDLLDEGKAVSVLEPASGATAIDITIRTPDGTSRVERVPFGGGRAIDRSATALPGVLISPELAEDLGLTSLRSSATLFSIGRPFTGDEVDTLELLADDVYWEYQAEVDNALGTRSLYINGAFGDEGLSRAQLKAIALGAALLLVLLVLAVGLALAAKDSEDERQVLAAVGAPPRALRRINVWRAVLLSLAAGIVAIPTGLLPAAVVVAAATPEVHDGRTLRPDLISIVFVLVALPCAAAIGTAIAGQADRLRPARPDTFDLTD